MCRKGCPRVRRGRVLESIAEEVNGIKMVTVDGKRG